MSNGIGTLKEILEIKDKHGFELIKNINTVRNIINTLQEQDSRSQRVGQWNTMDRNKGIQA